MATVTVPDLDLGMSVDIEAKMGPHTRLRCPACIRFMPGLGNDVVRCKCGATYRHLVGPTFVVEALP